MKKNILMYIAALGLLLAGSGCNDWLEVDPIDKVLEEKQFSNEDYINSALNGLYRQLSSANLYGGQLSQTTVETLAHYYLYSNSTSNFDAILLYQLANWSYTGDKAKGKMLSIWKEGFATLLNINNYLKGLNESEALLSKEHRNLLLGEAYGLRAYLAFDLFRLFGPYPYNANSTERVLPYNRNASITLNHEGYENDVYNTPKEYIDYLLADIQQAAQLLTDDPIIDPASESITRATTDGFYKNRNRRMNYYALKGLEARVLQYIGRESEAAAAAKVVTDLVEADVVFHWTDKTRVVNEKNYNFFSEIIFGINDIDYRSRGTSWYLGEVITKEVYVVYEENLMKNIFGGYTSASVEALGDLDVRAKQWGFSNLLPLDNAAVSFFPSGATYISQKYKVVADDAYSAQNDLQPLMRLPEMYYIQAEAAMNAGNMADAVALVNKVLERKVSSDQYFLKATATELELREALTREYYREFFGEGQAYFYLKRTQSKSIYNGRAEGTVSVGSGAFSAPIPDEEKNI